MASSAMMISRKKDTVPVNKHGKKHSDKMASAELKQVTVLSKTDWDRIEAHLNRRHLENEKAQKDLEERQHLHELSMEKVKNWSNTVYGQRQKKLEARKQREEQEEEERKKVDIEEAKYQAQQRRDAIERAKMQQYYQTDRIKGFHSALILTETLKEREAQLELKRLQEKNGINKDREWLERTKTEYEAARLADEEEARKNYEKNRATVNFQKAQMMERMRQMEREKEELRAEGEELHRLAAQYAEEKQKLDLIRQKEAAQQKVDNLRQMEDIKFMKHIDKMQEEEEDEDCRMFAMAKRTMMKKRAEKENQMIAEKQERLERIRDKLAAQMKEQQDDEDERIRRAVEEKEAKKAREEAEKEEKRRLANLSIKEHRIEQGIEKHLEQQKMEQRNRDLEMLKARIEADAVVAANELEKKRKRFEDSRMLSNMHLEQTAERKRLEREIIEQELEQERRNRELLEIEEQQFQMYANGVINDREQRGRNTIPLRKAAREGAGGGLGPVFPGRGPIRPSYIVADGTGAQLPNYQRSTTDETKRNMQGDSKRLGFVW